MHRKFDHDGNTFEIRDAVLGNRYCVKVFLLDKQVSPEYSATMDVGSDYFAQHQDHIINELAKIAEGDVRAGIYFSA